MTRTAAVVLAIVCVTAGAGGTYLALRHDPTPVTAAESIAANPGAPPVAESEGVRSIQGRNRGRNTNGRPRAHTPEWMQTSGFQVTVISPLV